MFVAILLYILHLLLLASPLVYWFAPEALPILLTAVLAKAVADGAFLWRAATVFEQRRVLRWFPFVELLIVPYVAVFCALGTLRPASWT